METNKQTTTTTTKTLLLSALKQLRLQPDFCSHHSTESPSLTLPTAAIPFNPKSFIFNHPPLSQNLPPFSTLQGENALFPQSLFSHLQSWVCCFPCLPPKAAELHLDCQSATLSGAEEGSSCPQEFSSL